MAKTRRKKINHSPARPFGARTHAVVTSPGDTITTGGIRGRTEVKRVTDEDGKRLASVRITADVPQIAAKDGAHIFVDRIYTGVPRGKTYPYRSVKRGAPPTIEPKGLLATMTDAVKRVVLKK